MKSRTNCYFNCMQFVTRLFCTVFVIASVCHNLICQTMTMNVCYLNLKWNHWVY